MNSILGNFYAVVAPVLPLCAPQKYLCPAADNNPVFRPAGMLVRVNGTPLIKYNLPHYILSRCR